MSDTKISALTALAATPANNDLAAIVDVSDTSMAASGTTKFITVANLLGGVQPLDSDLTAIAALTTTAFGRSVLTLADAAAMRTLAGLGTIATQDASNVTITGGSVAGITDLAVVDGGTGASTAANARTNLGLVIGTDVQAFDSDLAAIAALSTTAFGRAFLALADAAAARTAIGAVIGTNVQAWDADLDALAAIAGVQGDIIYHNGTSWVRLAAGSSGNFLKTQGAGANPTWAAPGGGGDLLAANNLSDVANPATARTNLGLAIGTNVQAWDTDLDTWATKTPPSGTVVGTSDSQTLTNKTLTTPVITLEQGTAPAQTGEGRVQWDTDDDKLVVGTGAATATFSNDTQNAAAYQPKDTELTALAGLTSAADKLPYWTGSGTAANADFTSAGRALVDDASAAAQRVTLGVDQRTTVNNTTYTVLATDRYVAQTGTMSASRAFTLPAASAFSAGQKVVIADESGTVTGTNTIVITRAGSDTIDGATTATINTAYGWRTLISNGSNAWTIIARDATSGGGAVSSDTIWDAAGDLAVGTGADTAAKLTKGTAGQVLVAGSSTLSWAAGGYSRTTFSNAAVSISATDKYVAQVGTMSASRAATLPAANAVGAGYEIVIADESGTVTTVFPIVVTRAGSDTINGGTTDLISSPYGQRRLISDGTSKWTSIRQHSIEVTTGYAALASGHAFPGSGSFGEVNISAVADTAYLVPVVVSVPMTVDAAALQVATTGTAVNARMVLWSVNSGVATLSGAAATVHTDFGTVVVSSTGFKTATITAKVILPGLYVLGVVADGTYSNRAVQSPFFGVGISNKRFATNFCAWSWGTATHTYGAAANLTSISAVTDSGAQHVLAPVHMRWIG